MIGGPKNTPRVRKVPSRYRNISDSDTTANEKASRKTTTKRKKAPTVGSKTNDDELTNTKEKRPRTTAKVKKKKKEKKNEVPETTVVQVDQEFVANAIAYSRNQTVAKQLWNSVGKSVQERKEVAFAALKRGAITFATLPENIKNNREFLTTGLENNMFPWKLLPRKYRQEVDFGLKALENNTTNVMNVVYTVTDIDKLWKKGVMKIMKRAADRNDRNCCINVLDRAPTSIKNDRAIQLKMVLEAPEAARYLSNALKEDHEFIHQVLKQNILSLPHFGGEVYARFPIMSIEKIKVYLTTVGSSHDSLLLSVPNQHWQERTFVEGWVSCGGDLTRKMASSLLDDEEIIFNYAENCMHRNNNNGFDLVSKRLISDKIFLKRIIVACKIPEEIFKAMPSVFTYDNEFLLLACSTHPAYHPRRNSRYSYFHRYNDRSQDFVNWVQKCMKEYQGFFYLLRGTAQASSGNALVALDQGQDLKKHIASFLMFPQGEKLTMLLKTAAINLKIRGYSNPYDLGR